MARPHTGPPPHADPDLPAAGERDHELANREMSDRREVVIVGGGPAGLSCAMVLGRSRRSTLVCDAGMPRNRTSRAMHGYLGRDGTAPASFLAIARAEAARYAVEMWRGRVVAAVRSGREFRVELEDGRAVACRRLVLATGVEDVLPDVPGAEELFGRGLHHCPYCDGWELRDRAIAVYGRGDRDGAGFACTLTQWSRDLVLCTDGPSGCSERGLAALSRAGIRLIEERIVRFAPGPDGVDILLASGERLRSAGVFFNTTRRQQSDLARRLGCVEAAPEGCDLDSPAGRTSVDGLYVVGDASRDVLQVSVAAAEGTRAAIDINAALLREDGILPDAD
jgi:thioredoxin reductase